MPLFATVQTAVHTDSIPQNVLACNLALGQEAVASYTVLIDLGLAELRNVRDSVAPRS